MKKQKLQKLNQIQQKLKKEIEILKQVVYEQGGGGKFVLNFQYDVDRDTALLGCRFLQYEHQLKVIGEIQLVLVVLGKQIQLVFIQLKNVGIGNISKNLGFALDVSGNARITGILTLELKLLLQIQVLILYKLELVLQQMQPTKR